MNRAELRRACRQHLAEAGAGMYRDDDIDAQLDRSARSLAAELGLLNRRAQLTTDDEGRGVLPGDAVSVRRVWWSAGRSELSPMRADDLPMPGEVRGAGMPTHFAHDPTWGGTNLAIHPGRSAALTVEIRSAGQPMTTDEAQPWNGAWEMYHDIIGFHAADKLLTKAGPNAAQQTVFAQRYQQRLSDFKGAVALQMTDAAPMHLAGIRPRRWRM